MHVLSPPKKDPLKSETEYLHTLLFFDFGTTSDLFDMYTQSYNVGWLLLSAKHRANAES